MWSVCVIYTTVGQHFNWHKSSSESLSNNWACSTHYIESHRTDSTEFENSRSYLRIHMNLIAESLPCIQNHIYRPLLYHSRRANSFRGTLKHINVIQIICAFLVTKQHSWNTVGTHTHWPPHMHAHTHTQQLEVHLDIHPIPSQMYLTYMEIAHLLILWHSLKYTYWHNDHVITKVFINQNIDLESSTTFSYTI